MKSQEKFSCTKIVFRVPETKLKLDVFLISKGRSLYIFAATNSADFFANSVLRFGISGDIFCFECFGRVHVL